MIVSLSFLHSLLCPLPSSLSPLLPHSFSLPFFLPPFLSPSLSFSLLPSPSPMSLSLSHPEILDYRVSNSPLQFFAADGPQTQCTYVQAIEDGVCEFTEFFTYTLSSRNPSIIVVNPTALVQIVDRRDGQN